MTQLPSAVRATLLIGDRTLRGYTRLALLHDDIATTTLTLAELSTGREEIAASVIVIDSLQEVDWLNVAGPELLSRTILIDAKSADTEARHPLYAVLRGVDAESIVKCVRACMTAHGGSEAVAIHRETPTPEPLSEQVPESQPELVPDPVPPAEEAVLPKAARIVESALKATTQATKKAVRRIQPKSNRPKPKKRR